MFQKLEIVCITPFKVIAAFETSKYLLPIWTTNLIKDTIKDYKKRSTR